MRGCRGLYAEILKLGAGRCWSAAVRHGVAQLNKNDAARAKNERLLTACCVSADKIAAATAVAADRFLFGRCLCC